MPTTASPQPVVTQNPVFVDVNKNTVLPVSIVGQPIIVLSELPPIFAKGNTVRNSGTTYTVADIHGQWASLTYITGNTTTTAWMHVPSMTGSWG